MKYLERIETLDADIIAEFRKTRKSIAIPEDLQKYILQLDAVIEIRDTEKFDNISRIAKALKKRYPELPDRTARQRVYDAYTLFHINDNVSNDVWDKLYADKMENLARLCIARGKEDIAYKAFIRAHELRTRAESRIKPEDLKAPIFIISNKIKPEDVGFESANLQKIASKASDGHYAKLINKLPVSDEEKKKLYEDAEIQDAQIIEDE
jgi:hypothetical protein